MAVNRSFADIMGEWDTLLRSEAARYSFRARRLRRALLLGFSLAASGCLSTGAPGGLPKSPGEAEAGLGSFSASLPAGASGGAAWSVTEGSPAACISGEHQFFFGVDLADPRQGAVLRLALDPLNGAAVRVFDPADPERRSLVVRPGDCRTFRYLLEPTGWRINDYRDFRLEMDLDCKTAGGATVRAALSAAHCH